MVIGRPILYVYFLSYTFIGDPQMSLETLNARSTERHTHESGSISDEGLLCPTCDQPVSPEKFEDIQGKERARAAKIERTLQARFAGEMAKVEATKKAEVAKAKQEAAAQIEKVKREAANAAKAALAPKLAEAEQQIKSLKADQKAVIDQRLKEQREALDKARVEAVNAEKATGYAERMRLDAKLQELTRQLQRKTANEIGDKAEVDLYTALKSEFLTDNIYRVKKGHNGADIVHLVIENGKTVGKIIYDSKDRMRWQHAFTRKLREDQLTEKADHAVLCTNVFPAGTGTRNLHIQHDVVVVDRRRVLVLANILRRQVIQVSMLRLADDDRRAKTAELYQFVTSEQCRLLWDRLVEVGEDMAALDTAEANAHQRTWTKRAALVAALRDVHDKFVSTVGAIIGIGEPAEAETEQ
jgi:hypothetical protein